MAPHPYWKGYLKLSLVTCPVSMSPATSESDKVRFHTLNRETGNRVVSQYVDAITRPLPSSATPWRRTRCSAYRAWSSAGASRRARAAG
jgi:hypothetical protein